MGAIISIAPNITIDNSQAVERAFLLKKMKKSSVSPLNPTQVEKAIAKYTKEIANDPLSAEMHADLGHLYFQQKRWQAAKKSYEQAVKIDPEFAEAHRHLAQIWTHLNNPYKASDSLDLAFKLKPNSATAQQHHKLCYFDFKLYSLSDFLFFMGHYTPKKGPRGSE